MNGFRKLWLIVVVLGAMTVQGCTLFLVGAAGATGYAISKDSVEGFVDQRFSKVWSVVEKTLEDRGGIVLKDKDAGRIDAQVEGSDVEAWIEEIDGGSIRIKIKARKTKGLMPDVKLAQDIYTQVLKKL